MKTFKAVLTASLEGLAIVNLLVIPAAVSSAFTAGAALFHLHTLLLGLLFVSVLLYYRRVLNTCETPLKAWLFSRSADTVRGAERQEAVS